MKKILVIDDESDFVEALGHLLKVNDFDAELVSTYQAAEEKIRANTYDIIVSDIKIGNDSGMDLLKIAQEVQKDTPFVVMSGFLDYNHEETLKEGAIDFFQKPMDITLFIDRLKKIANKE